MQSSVRHNAGETHMERKTFDAILTSVGAVLTLFLLVAGVLGLWAYSFTNTNVHNQLASSRSCSRHKQRSRPPSPGTEITPGMLPYLQKYAGQPSRPVRRPRPTPTTSSPCTSKRSAGASPTHSSRPRQCTAQGSAAYTADEAVVQTVFQGTTLRGLLLEAYAFWKMGPDALWAAIACFVAAAVMLVLTILGFVHLRRVPARPASSNRFPDRSAGTQTCRPIVAPGRLGRGPAHLEEGVVATFHSVAVRLGYIFNLQYRPRGVAMFSNIVVGTTVPRRPLPQWRSRWISPASTTANCISSPPFARPQPSAAVV